MNPRNRRSLGWLWLACLACSLISLSPRVAGGSPWQAQSPDTEIYGELPRWRVDFKKPDPTSPDLKRPPGFFQVMVNDSTLSKTSEPNADGILTLPDIPIGAGLDERLFEIFRDGMFCDLQTETGVLRRETASPSPQPGDEIPLLARPPEGSGVGWVEVKVSDEKITRDNGAAIRLSIHHWDEIAIRVGAGIFQGHLDLGLHHPKFYGNKPIRVRQPLIVVIAGSRVISVQTPKATRFGAKPEVRVELETVEPPGGSEVDPGWWLQVAGAGDHPPLVRLPLPIRESTTFPGALFSLKFEKGAEGDVRCWDTLEIPRKIGYELAGDWKKDALIIQRRQRGPNDAGMGLVEVHRHTVTTYLPPYSQVGEYKGLVYWDPRSEGNAVPGDPIDPAWENATRRSTGPIVVRSGLRFSPNLPLANEPVQVSLAIAANSDLTKKEAFDKAPEQLSAEVWVQDNATKEWSYQKAIDLYRQAVDPAEPSVAIYQGKDTLDAAGRYKIKLSYGGGNSAGTEAKAVPPPDWDDLRSVEVPVHVALEGEDPSAPSLMDDPAIEDDSAIKVFTDGQPFWWLSGEPRFPNPYKNERNTTGFQTNTNQATSFRLAPGQDVRSIKVRFQGLFFDPTSNEQVNDDALRRFDNASNAAYLRIYEWEGPSGFQHAPFKDEDVIKLGQDFDLKDGDGGVRQFFDVDVEIGDTYLSADQRRAARGLGKQLRLARFALVGLDGAGRPFGRIYTRRFQVSVRSVWDELWDVVNSHIEVVALLGLALVIGIAVLHNRARKRRRKERAKASLAAVSDDDEQQPAQAGSDSRDYFKGLDPVDEEPVTRPDKPPQAPASPPPALDASYFDKPDPAEESGRGDEYFD